MLEIVDYRSQVIPLQTDCPARMLCEHVPRIRSSIPVLPLKGMFEDTCDRAKDM